ncbi:hypothetical protein GCM10012275_29190 [Longimycelium tulufanense]|uniref:Uncharacterized protein n=1 Tax=Longimycelium tulufanense TaxID=907463 RepID=A0A8J3CG85_9PSEU|nr:flagellar basal body protein FliL [Longimycelium tulufanense]GGM56266.1 hypothetical protein GCM10012275_29190 [Longimycelium tulufanense]
MSNPGGGDQWSPQQPNPQGFPPPGQPGYPPTTMPGQGWSGAPQPPQPQPGWGPDPAAGQQPPFGQPPYAYPAPPPAPRRKRTGLLVGALVAVVALAAGGVGGWYALRQAAASGEENPTAAATRLLTAVGNNDVVGLMDGLAPAEAALARESLGGTVDELKRLEILKPEADPANIGGLQVTVEGLRFDDAAAEVVNDHLTITKLVEGKITINSDLNQLPLTDRFLTLTKLDRTARTRESETVDIAEEVRKKGEPVRIATVRTDDGWYPSLFYTIADHALLDAGEKWPTQSIPANGADSPEAALRAMVEAAGKADVRRLIELLPPDEMAVLHDVGPLLVDKAAAGLPTGGGSMKVVELDVERKDVPGGVSLLPNKFVAEADGQRVSFVRDGECYDVTLGRQRDRVCAADVAKQMGKNSRKRPPKAVREMVDRIMTSLTDVGLVTVEIDGRWYVSPGRTMNEVWLSVLRGLQPKDIEELAKLSK